MSANSVLMVFAGTPDDNLRPRTGHRIGESYQLAPDPGGMPIPERPLPEDDFVTLWRAVILQMFKDAVNNWQTMEKEPNRSRAHYNNLRAREWLNGRWPDDFEDVCERARLDPGAVRRRGEDLIAGRITLDQSLDPIDHAKAIASEGASGAAEGEVVQR